MKYDVLGNCVVKDDINEAKTRSAVRDPINLQNKVKFCKKKMIIIIIFYKDNYLSVKFDTSIQNVKYAKNPNKKDWK